MHNYPEATTAQQVAIRDLSLHDYPHPYRVGEYGVLTIVVCIDADNLEVYTLTADGQVTRDTADGFGGWETYRWIPERDSDSWWEAVEEED